jgi:predicted O-methyltransferase YrrM
MLGDDLALLDAALNEAKVVVEYGSGASTIHIGNRLRDWGSLVSVEHDPEWFAKVGEFLEVQNLDNVTLLLREPKTGKTIRPWQRFSDREMADYVTAPRSEVGEGTADLVFVDGRQRINCALEAVKLLKSGALLMVHDFWPRFRYRARLSELLAHYDYLLESPCLEKDQGMAVFRKK